MWSLIKGNLARFFAWWFGELAALVPARWRRTLGGGGRALVIDLTGPEAVIRREVGDQRHELGRFDAAQLPPEDQRRAFAEMMREAPSARTDPAVIRLPAEQVLQKTLTLPMAAEGDLGEALSFQIDRQTPFSADEVCFDYFVSNRDSDAKRLTVQMVAAPKAVVERTVARVADWGVSPSVVDVAGTGLDDAVRLNLLSGAAHTEGRPRWSRLNLGFAGLAAILIAIAVYLPLEQKRAAAAALEARVQEARIEAKEAARLREELDRLVKQDRFLLDKKTRTVSVVQILNELTQLLPDDSWVQEFRWQDGKVRLTGYSASASALIGLIGSSPSFETPAFLSPVTQDSRTGQERFNLSFALEPRQ
ncbi:MAG: pilus assembly protein PilM [Alphaproteobacteria bacterium]|nr:pilus assembly protein PilM [Alphaproteobacteria bacterium]